MQHLDNKVGMPPINMQIVDAFNHLMPRGLTLSRAHTWVYSSIKMLALTAETLDNIIKYIILNSAFHLKSLTHSNQLTSCSPEKEISCIKVSFLSEACQIVPIN